MEMLMLLLVSAVAQLVSPVAAAPTKNQPLNNVIDEVLKYNTSLYQEYFVEDVTELADAGCNDAFFCKVRQILIDHHQNKSLNGDKKVLRTLEVYINSTNINCDEALKDVNKSDKSKPLPILLENLTKCSRLANFNGRRTTSKPS